MRAKPTAVLFDWDNTLVDTWPGIHKAIEATMVYMGHDPWSLEEVKQKAHASARDAFPRMFGDNWVDAYQFFYDFLNSQERFPLDTLKGASETLFALHQADVPMGIVSNKRGDHLRLEVEQMGWAHFFQSIVGSGDSEKDKPHPDPIWKALDLMGLKPSINVLFVGDTPVDWQASERAGCFSVALAPVEDTPILRVETHQELLDFLKL